MSLGITQLILILCIVLVFFGAGKLPSVMGDLGKGMRKFRQGLNADEEKENKLDSKSAEDAGAENQEQSGEDSNSQDNNKS